MAEAPEKDQLLSPTTAPTPSAVIASRSAVDGLFSKYHLPFLRQLVDRTRGDVEGIKVKLRGIVEESYPNLLDAADNVGSIHRTIDHLGKQARGLEDRLVQAKTLADSSSVSSLDGPSVAEKSAGKRFGLAARVYALREANLLHMEALREEKYEEAVIWLVFADQLDHTLLEDSYFSHAFKTVPYMDGLRERRQRDKESLEKHLSSLLLQPNLASKDVPLLIRPLLLLNPSISLLSLLSDLLKERSNSLSSLPFPSKSISSDGAPSPWISEVANCLAKSIVLWTHTVELASCFLEQDLLIDQGSSLPSTTSSLVALIFSAPSQKTITKDSSSLAPFAPWDLPLSWRSLDSSDTWDLVKRQGKEALEEWVYHSQDTLVRWIQSLLDLVQRHQDLSWLETTLGDLLLEKLSPTWNQRVTQWGIKIPSLWDDMCGPFLMKRHTQLIRIAFTSMEERVQATFSSLLASPDQAESIWQTSGSFAPKSPDQDQGLQGLFTVSDALANMEAAIQSIVDDVHPWLSCSSPTYPAYLGQSGTLWKWMITGVKKDSAFLFPPSLLILPPLPVLGTWKTGLVSLLDPLLKQSADHEELKEKLMTGSISMYTKSVERFIQQHVDALVRGEGLQVSEGTRMKSPCKDALRILLDLALALHGHLGWILDDKVGLGGLWIRTMTVMLQKECKQQVARHQASLEAYWCSGLSEKDTKREKAILLWVCQSENNEKKDADLMDTLSKALPDEGAERKEGILRQCASMCHLLGPLSPFSKEELVQRDFGGPSGKSSTSSFLALSPQIPRLTPLPLLPGDGLDE
ncbi:MAG: hypothetical protein DHS80DRAFT_23791 [Piptocephalis tieghemiana]|nr:MAG: hypothetical protein DHS80DRAFT_23791 [Piptocephalis tieghemiana]